MSTVSSVELDFRVDEERVAAMRRSWDNLRNESWAYGLALFDAPIFLKVSDVVLLNWIPAPLYSVASLGLARLQKLPTTSTTDVPFWGTSYRLLLRLKDRTAEITEEANDISVEATHEELLAAWSRFAERVRTFVVTEFPEVVQRTDHIGAWFRGEETHQDLS